jgi:hypothetical protein
MNGSAGLMSRVALLDIEPALGTQLCPDQFREARSSWRRSWGSRAATVSPGVRTNPTMLRRSVTVITLPFARC